MSKTKTGLSCSSASKGGSPTAMEGWKGQLFEAEIENVLAYVLTLRK